MSLKTTFNQMAYDEFLADHIRSVLQAKQVAFEKKKMMGGICFMVDDKMCVGTDQDKRTSLNRFMARIGTRYMMRL